MIIDRLRKRAASEAGSADTDAVPDGGTNMQQAYQRARKLLNDLWDRTEGKICLAIMIITVVINNSY